MKKDKEWLKEELVRDLMRFNGNPNMTDYESGIASGVINAINLTEKLDEPEITFKQAHDKLREESILSEKSFDYYWNCINDNVEIDEPGNLLVPKQEKPVIPQFVADWIDAHNLHGNNPLREYRDLEIDFNEGWTDEEDAAVYHWVNENPYAFIDALRYSYEVEKEKKYQVIIRDGEYIRLYLCKHGDNVIIGTNDNYIEKCPEVTYLTEQEIKDYDERYWAFAQEVTQ